MNLGYLLLCTLLHELLLVLCTIFFSTATTSSRPPLVRIYIHILHYILIMCYAANYTRPFLSQMPTSVTSISPITTTIMNNVLSSSHSTDLPSSTPLPSPCNETSSPELCSEDESTLNQVTPCMCAFRLVL